MTEEEHQFTPEEQEEWTFFQRFMNPEDEKVNLEYMIEMIGMERTEKLFLRIATNGAGISECHDRMHNAMDSIIKVIEATSNGEFVENIATVRFDEPPAEAPEPLVRKPFTH